MFLTIWHNYAVLPVTESVPIDFDPVELLGKPDTYVGGWRSWNTCNPLYIVVTTRSISYTDVDGVVQPG